MKVYVTGSCLICFVLLMLCGQLPAQSIVINEVMTSNTNIIRDEDGDTPDWIELYNKSSIPVDLQNWTLSDDSLERDKWMFHYNNPSR